MLVSVILVVNVYFIQSPLLKADWEIALLSIVMFYYFSIGWPIAKRFDKALQGLIENSKMFSHSIVLLLFTLGYIVCLNAFKAKRILSGYPYYNIQIEGSTSFKTTKSLVYIGSTKDYHFFRNLETNSNEVINNSDVTKIKIEKITHTPR